MEKGIKETKEMVDAIISLVVAVDKSLVDGKFGYEDIPLLMEPALKLSEAFAGSGEIKHEIKDIDEAEKAELVLFIEEKLQLRSENTEEVIELALNVGSMIHKLYGMVKK